MSCESFEQVAAAEVSSFSTVPKHTCKLEWRVTNFSSMAAGVEHCSPSVSSSEQPNYKWCIGFSTAEAGANKHILVSLKPDFSVPDMVCSFYYMLSVENSDGRRISEWTVASDVLPDHSPSHTSHRIEFANVIAALVDDDLMFRAEVSFILLPPGGIGRKFVHDTRMGIGASLLGDLSTMLGNNAFSDVKIIVEDSGTSVTIPAHQILLASRSTFFHDKLTEDSEKADRCIRISDLDANTVRHMLAYIYADRFDKRLSTEEVINLLKCAENYLLPGLKKLCELHLIENIHLDNAFECWIAADRHSADELKAISLKTICKSTKNIASIKNLLNSDRYQIDQEQRLCLLTEVLWEISSNLLPN